MINIFFKNIEKSQLAVDIVKERINRVSAKFPDLKTHTINVILFVDNSVVRPGLDSYGIKLLISGKKYGGIIIEKTNQSLYTALDEIIDVILEAINRKGDKQRIRNRRVQRSQKLQRH